jgi:hypothetical protein
MLSTLALRMSGDRPLLSRFLTRKETLSGVVSADEVDPAESEDLRLNGVYGVEGVDGDLNDDCEWRWWCRESLWGVIG